MSEEQVVLKSKKTKEERITEIDKKIADYENKIERLKERRENILHPLTYADVGKEANRRKISPKKLAELLDSCFPADPSSDKD